MKPILGIAFMFLFTITFFMLQGKHGGLYFLQVNSIRNIGTCLIFTLLFLECLTGVYSKYIVKWAKIFCVSYCIVQLYTFLPVSIAGLAPVGSHKTYVHILLYIFNAFWFVTGIILAVMYYIFCRNENI